MSDQPSIRIPTAPKSKPVPEGYSSWNDYWTRAHNHLWRTEPEIDTERQDYLTARRAIIPDIEQGIYPFKDIPLTRADVEWLLATHESGGMRGTVDWDDAKHRQRDGLDVRGADLRTALLDNLPLARLHAGLGDDDWPGRTPRERSGAAVHLEGASLRQAHLEGAILRRAHLEGVNLYQARLEDADLRRAYLNAADLYQAHLARASLAGAFLSGDENQVTRLDEVDLTDDGHSGPFLADTQWGNANLTVIEWRGVRRLSDEVLARRRRDRQQHRKGRKQRLREYQAALRAYRQLATILRDQGLNEAADQFAYRAQVVRRQVLRRQRQVWRALVSWFLDVLAGYGYKPERSLLAYLSIISVFAGAYLINAQFAAPHLTWDEALVLSISAFHGRGFFTSGISLGDTLARLAAGEAIIGLLLEITFIATITKRFFGQ